MWQPLKQEDLNGMIEAAEAQMEPSVHELWNRIKITPRKWQITPWGDSGGGFWVVAIIGKTCVYYNDIEDGFNSSLFEHWGYIEEYSCNQTDLFSFITDYRDNLTAVIAPKGLRD